jgi:hypothetical protein
MKEQIAHFLQEHFFSLRQFNYLIERRNSIRLISVPDELRKSAVIKFAETKDEYEQAFSLVYNMSIVSG